MNILIVSYLFYPSIGGIETTSELFANGFVAKGYRVKLITHTPSDHDDQRCPFEVVRQPSPMMLCKLISWSDIVFHNNISLNFAWPLLFIKRPWAITHHTWIKRQNGGIGWQDHLKRLVIRFAANIAINQSMADHLQAPCTVIPVPYEDPVFYRMQGITRDKELIYVGRLVTDKGVDTLITALNILRTRGLKPILTIVGDGPEKRNLQALVQKMGLEMQVKFVGSKSRSEVAVLLNAHKILVVPSLWNEPFGLVALEGIACGCVVVGSQGGGLPVTIGPCGVTFQNGSAEGLAAALTRLFSNQDLLASYEENTRDHASHHTVAVTIEKYLKVFEQTVKGVS